LLQECLGIGIGLTPQPRKIIVLAKSEKEGQNLRRAVEPVMTTTMMITGIPELDNVDFTFSVGTIEVLRRIFVHIFGKFDDCV
jgi:hypothetical protein